MSKTFCRGYNLNRGYSFSKELYPLFNAPAPLEIKLRRRRRKLDTPAALTHRPQLAAPLRATAPMPSHSMSWQPSAAWLGVGVGVG